MAGPARTASAPVDYAQAGELKIGQVGVANLRIRTLDVPQLESEMRDRVARGPAMFGRAAVIVDFGGLPQTPDKATAQSLLDALRRAGVLPVALAWGSSDNEQLAIQLGLPLLAKFRAQYEPADGSAPHAASPQAAVAPPAAPAAASATASADGSARKAPPAARGAGGPDGSGGATVSPGLIQTAPVRSGQQVYADNRDLTVLTAVGAGAEVIADGSIHIYGALRGRALAGARGNMEARIFCREFHAELVAIAGHYKVLEDVPAQLRGKPVQVWLEHEELKIAALEP